MTADNLLACALKQIDQANLADPNQEMLDGILQPKEYVYSERMTCWLFKLEPAPSEMMQIACRAQHIERWTMPRSDYPEGRKAYYQWRMACNEMHASRAAEIMKECGYPAEDCARVKTIISKRKLRNDAETQLLEDVACLVFLEHYLAGFHQQKADYDQERWLRIMRRTWGKMSGRGQEVALTLVKQLPEALQKLLRLALG